MRKYTLASPAARINVDLRDYEDIIKRAVHDIVPEAEVKVEEHCYYVSPELQQGDAVRVGRLICQSDLRIYCVQIPKLFSSVHIDEKEEKRNGTKKKCVGGHH